MAPVVAAALISAAATAVKAKQDQKANASQGAGNYAVDMKTPDSGSQNAPSVKVDSYQPSGNGGGGNNMSWVVDTAANVANKAINSKAEKENKEEEKVASDERLKNIFGDNEDAIKVFANLDAIKFTYNDKAKEIPDSEESGVDDDIHYGLKAQDLANNPLTESAVSKDPISDYLKVDTKELTMANTAIISEICKRILIIEKVLRIKVV